MKRLMCLVMAMLLFNTEQAISGKSTSIEFIPINSYEILDFTSVNDGWLDPAAKFEEELQRLSKAGGGYKPSKAEMSMLREAVGSTDKYKLLAKLASEQHVIFRLGIMMPDDVQLHIEHACLNFELQRDDGRTISIVDAGVICPLTTTPMKEWADSRSAQVVLTNSFSKGRPGDWPVIVYVRMPRSVLGAKVLKVTPTDKLGIVYSQQPVIFR